MNFLDRLRFVLSSKESQARIVTTMKQIGLAVATPANYENFALQGYSGNTVVYSAISKIATACAGINWEVYSKKGSKLTQVEESPLLALIERPNPLQAQASFIEAVVAFRLISGNSYIEANQPFAGKPPLELWPVRPDKMKVIGGLNGYPSAYEFSYNGNSRRWPVDQVKMQSQIMHWKMFNPLNDWYGLSPLQAAMLSLDQNNYGQRWNLALLKNSATPSGVLQMKVSDVNPRGELTELQYIRIKKEFEEGYQGARHAGKPLILEGGLNWTNLSLSPKEVDFLKGREANAIDLCVAYGVPPEMMGLGQKTFANYAEARLAFYEETVLPTMDSLRDSLNMWLTPSFGEGIYLDYDKDDIEALLPRRTGLFTSLAPVKFLTVNEKRKATGYDDIEGGDELDAQTPAPFGAPAPDNQDPPVDPAKKPPKKPKPDDTEVDPADDEETDDNAKSFKSVNLFTRVEKVQSWKKQNAHRAQLQKRFAREAAVDFNSLGAKLAHTANSLKGSDTKVIEYALHKVATDWSLHELTPTLKKNIQFTLEDFGGTIFGDVKSAGISFIETKANLKFDHYVKDYVKRHTAKQISTINGTNEKTIRRVVSKYVQQTLDSGGTVPDLADMLQNKFDELSDASANRIARTEVGMASSNGSLNAIKSLQVPNMTKEWVSAEDDRVRDGDHGGADHASVDGDVVDIDDKFTVPPDASMDCPGDLSADADQVINCRCVLVYKQAKGKNDDE